MKDYKKERYYYFYDLNEVLIDRYPAKIANHISDNLKCNNFVFIYSNIIGVNKPKKIPDGSKIYYISDLNKKKLDEIVKQYPPISLTTIAQRIPDLWMLTYFNHMNIPTFVVQHGLWSDRSVRISFIPLIVGKLFKFINYIKHVNAICKLNNIPFLRTIIDLYHFWLKEDIYIPETKCLHNELLRAKKVFVYDSSWDDYYLNKFGYKKDEIIYIGNPDFMVLKDKDIENKEDAVCYLCQSIVEDGRYSIKEYRKFQKVLKNAISSKKKLYIKFHPRSKRKYYSIFENNKNIIFTHDLPICKYYIGHYSSLLATIKQITDNILIWKLSNHHTPEYFFQYGSIVTEDQRDLVNFVEDKLPNNSNPSIKKLTKEELKTFDPIKIISLNIIKTNH